MSSKDDDKSVDELLAEAECAHQEHRWAPIGAAPSFYKVLDKDPLNKRAFEFLCSVLAEAGCHQEHRQLCENRIKLDPTSASAYFSLSLACSNLRDYPASLAAAKKCAEYEPGKPHTWRRLAQIAQMCGDQDSCNLAFAKLNELEAVSPADLSSQARALIKEGRLQQAFDKLQRLVAVQPDNAAAWMCLSAVASRARMRDLDQSARKKATELKPQSAYWLYEADTLMAETENGVVAEIFLRYALELEPEAWHLHASLARALRAQGKVDEADESEKRSRELRPTNV